MGKLWWSKDTCLKECGDGITHSASPYRRESHEHDQSHSALSSGDCKGLFKEISGVEQTVLTVKEIEKGISALMNKENQLTGRNSTYDTHVYICFEYLDDHSSFSIQAHLEKANDSSVFSGSQKMMPWSRRVEDPLWKNRPRCLCSYRLPWELFPIRELGGWTERWHD